MDRLDRLALFPNCLPWFLVEDLDGKFAGRFDRAEDGEEDERGRVWIAGGVGSVFGDVSHFAGIEEAFFALDPLFGLAGNDVDNFFAGGVGVEFVGGMRREGGADEDEFPGADDFRIGHGFNVAPGEVGVLEVFGGNEVCWHGDVDLSEELNGEIVKEATLE